jgi:hypothetical protein
MPRTIRLRMSAFGSIFQIGRRHQGRHRGASTSPRRARFTRARGTHDGPAAITAGLPSQATSPQDFYVVFPNVPALPNNIGS